jgi:hypothetical protein
MNGISAIQIIIMIVLASFLFMGIDCIAGNCCGKFETMYGKVYDKETYTTEDNDGDKTHHYIIHVDTGSGIAKCDSSRSLYNDIKVGDGCRFEKRVGISGIGYGYNAVAKYDFKAEK